MEEDYCSAKIEVREWHLSKCIIAMATLSLSKDKFGEILSYMIYFVAFTPSSALPFDHGY